MSDQNLHFYRCALETYSTGHVYFDHTKGIAGYEHMQPRDRYIGCMTERELDEYLSQEHRQNSARSSFGQRVGYTNVAKSYNSRY